MYAKVYAPGGTVNETCLFRDFSPGHSGRAVRLRRRLQRLRQNLHAQPGLRFHPRGRAASVLVGGPRHHQNARAQAPPHHRPGVPEPGAWAPARHDDHCWKTWPWRTTRASPFDLHRCVNRQPALPIYRELLSAAGAGAGGQAGRAGGLRCPAGSGRRMALLDEHA